VFTLKEEIKKKDTEKFLEDSIKYREKKIAAEQTFLEDTKRYLEKRKKGKALSSK
jgi:hypothetical protein